jgi:anti-anti-sigma factor
MDFQMDGRNWKVIIKDNLVGPLVEPLCTQLLDEINRIESVATVTLDLSQCEHLDSPGIKLVVGLYKTCQIRNWPLEITIASTQLMHLFTLCKLDKIITLREVAANG